jgi:ABC-type thiamin/hydroxymethylpyrimidine transport system permease subunit
VTWYTWPTPELGFNWADDALDTTPTPDNPTPLMVQLTAAGAQVFSYLNAGPDATPIPIQYAYTYLATPLDAATTPLLTDGAGHALAAIRTFPDGRMNLAMTWDSNPHLLHTMLLSYGVVNWVTGGVFIGDRHVYMSPQVDDVFIDNTHWVGGTTEGTACGTPVDSTGGEVRMTGADLNAVIDWQQLRRLDPLTPALRLTLAFNGVGTTGIYSPDSLTSTAANRQGQFYWVSHTWDHESLDAPMTGSEATMELMQNNALATQMAFRFYSPMNLVQPNVSGLAHLEFLDAAYATGVRYLVSDTSKPAENNPAPNIGIWNALHPGMFQIPRRANNLFFNVATPADWVAEYNCMYRTYWGEDKNYAQLIDIISQELLAYLLRGELDPWMFHQPNLIAYDGTHTLLTDLLDATIAKYRGYYTLPILSLRMDQIGDRMAHRTIARTSGVTGTIQPGQGITLTSPVDVTIPVTGVRVTGAESYGGQWISWIALKANQPLFVPSTATPGTQPPTANAGPAQRVLSLTPVTLAGLGTDSNVPARPLTFAWTQTSGPAVTLAGAATATASFTAPMLPAGTASAALTFTLTVSNDLLSTSSTTTVTVVTPRRPTAQAGTSQTVNWNTSVTLNGVGTDVNIPPLPITFQWTQTSGPAVTLASATSAVTTFTAPNLALGAPNVALGFRLAVSNGAFTTTASTTVTVRAPRAPTSRAGAAQTVNWNTLVTLNGSGADSNTPPRPLTFAWTQTSGVAVTLANPAAAVTTFTAPTLPVGGANVVLGFRLTVTSALASTTSSTTVTVRAPRAPTASAGVSQTVRQFALVTLSGSGTDRNVPARPLTFTWTQTLGPAVTLSAPNAAVTTFTAPAVPAGVFSVTLRFRLAVSNGLATTTSSTTVTVVR